MPWAVPDAFTRSSSIRNKDTTKRVAPRNTSNNGSNRNSISSVNTFGHTSDMLYLTTSASISTPTSSVNQQSYSVSSSTHSTSILHRSGMTRHRKTGSMFGFLRELQREQSSLVQSQPVNFPEELEDKIAAEGGTGVGGSGGTGVRTKGRRVVPDERIPRNPRALQSPPPPLLLAPPEPSSSMHDPAMIENEIHALKRQIRQASTVLTHVVQTMSVPTPAALINLMQQDTSLQDKPPQGSRPHPSGCSCAILHARDDGKFGTGREVAFLAACYCPDPWKFQERVLRQVESMQQELQIHRQEMLEVEKRTTMKLRQEILKWERTRDKECVELNELLRRSHLISDMDEKERQMDSIRGNNPPLDDRAEDHGMDKREGKSTCQSEAEHGGQGTDPTEKQLSDDGDAANHQSTER